MFSVNIFSNLKEEIFSLATVPIRWNFPISRGQDKAEDITQVEARGGVSRLNRNRNRNRNKIQNRSN